MDRASFLERARDHAPYVGVETDEGDFLVGTADGNVDHGLFIERGRPEFRVLRLAVGVVEALLGDDAIEGRAFADVGANIGTATISALRSHGFASAVCCEPEPENFRLLEANLALNGLAGRSRALNVAVSDRPGRALLAVLADRRGKSWIGSREQIEAEEAKYARHFAEHPEAVHERRGGPRPEAEMVETELITLDSLDLDEVGMVWVDAEGHEGQILRGAGELTGRGVPLVTEFNPPSLDERGDRGAIHEIVERDYTHFTDVRRRKQYGLRAVAELREYADDLLRRDAFTDLLLLRLDEGQAQAKLPRFAGRAARSREAA